jgi:hypothetical protein
LLLANSLFEDFGEKCTTAEELTQLLRNTNTLKNKVKNIIYISNQLKEDLSRCENFSICFYENTVFRGRNCDIGRHPSGDTMKE